MKRTLWHGLWVVVCTLAVFVLPAAADSQARIVRLSYLNGSVQIDRNTGQGFERAIMNMPITQGTRLKTADGQAEVEFENGSTVRLAPETELVFDGLSLIDNGTKTSSMTLEQGVAYFNLDHKDKNQFSLQFSGRTLQLKKSAHFRIDLGRDRVRMAVFKGQVSLVGPGKQIAVHKDETFSFDPADQMQYALAKGIDEYQYDSWDQQREQYQNQYSRVSYNRSSPYYGWDDLNYYGSFALYPGYGYLWRPYGVGFGWDPFALGYWVWYPAWGYTWVSPYAWGWTPFRYGGWNYVPGYGWGWRPGPSRGWNPIPPVHNPPPTWHRPHPPAGPGSGVVSIGQPHPVPMAPIHTFADRGDHGNRRIVSAPLPTPNVRLGPATGNLADTPIHRSGTSIVPTRNLPSNPPTITPGNGGQNSPQQNGGHVFTPPSHAPTGTPSGASGGSRNVGGGHSSPPMGHSGGFGGGASMGGAGRSGGSSMGGGGGHVSGGGGGRGPR